MRFYSSLWQVEAGAGRDEANPQQARECKIWRNKLMFKVALTANKSLATMKYAEFRASKEVVMNYLS